MATYPHIENYHAEIDRFITFGGSDSELSIRRAFANCLHSYCLDHREKLALVDELGAAHGNRPDGTVKDSLRMTRGYWEAKDSKDDLESEIQFKFNRGYPRDNIIFEDSQTAVLIQNSQEAMRVDMTRPGELHRLIRAFLDYELPEIEEFRKAQQQFKADLPTVLTNLREAVQEAEAQNSGYQTKAANFLQLCRQSIGPAVSAADVREMVLQHILTQDIFLKVFSEDQFHRENNIASELTELAETFFTGEVRRRAVERLRAYYGAIGRAADTIAGYAEKQQFLKAIYEDFYKAYNPAAADRLGVVYTPNEVVDFIIRGTDHLLQKHFGRRLSDEKVQILDPATGTGTFVTNLISYLAGSGEPDALARLEHKYRNEVHANEVAILPYYIANLNIEYTYREKTRRYLQFPNLCFVDTLDNMDWEGARDGAVERQGAFNLGALSTENWVRVQLQNEKTISVIIGNPPYNANQQNENDNNKNREYPEIDHRISDTYIAASTAQKTKQYDMYKRFIRWASDRLHGDGIIAFVSNNAFLDSRQDDGFRKVVAQEFNELWVIDLKGNARTSGERRRREKGNIFEDKIRVGVAIYFLVRRQGTKGFRVFYNEVGDYLTSSQKIDYIKNQAITDFDFREIAPDADANWLNQSTSDFDSLLPLANRETKLAKFVSDERAVFRLYSLGILTARDEWVYDFDIKALKAKASFFCETYQNELQRHGVENPAPNAITDWVNRSIKWTSELETSLAKGHALEFRQDNVIPSLYRPFVTKYCYYAPLITHRRYQQPRIFPQHAKGGNVAFCFLGSGGRRSFSVLASDMVPSYALFIDGTQCLPLYRYRSGGERVSNITRWGIKRISDHYRGEWGTNFDAKYPGPGITAEHIFAYTYAVLHDPVYRQKYAIDLTRDFPRLPLYRNFDAWQRMGQELLDLHIGFESAKLYLLKRTDKKGEPTKVVLRPDKAGGKIVLDDKTTLTGVPPDAWRYRLGNRSALEWVLDQYKERKPRDPTIAEKFNTYRFADYKEQVIDLLKRVCTVSVRTMEIVDKMSQWSDQDTSTPASPGGEADA